MSAESSEEKPQVGGRWAYNLILQQIWDAHGRPLGRLSLQEVYLDGELEPSGLGRSTGQEVFAELHIPDDPDENLDLKTLPYEELDVDEAREVLRRELTRMLAALDKPIYEQTSDGSLVQHHK